MNITRELSRTTDFISHTLPVACRSPDCYGAALLRRTALQQHSQTVEPALLKIKAQFHK